jgi:hypothetical protein
MPFLHQIQGYTSIDNVTAVTADPIPLSEPSNFGALFVALLPGGAFVPKKPTSRR